MSAIPNISFNVRFDLLSTPTLVLTDTTASPPAGFVGIFSITQPDGYTRTGNISSPDISSAGGAFSYTLRLDSTGEVQRGTYTIKFTANAPGRLSTDFTRSFEFQYLPVKLSMGEEFDVFTPSLKYRDNTVYQVSNYNAGAVTRAWSGVSTPTGTKTGTTVLFDLKHNNNYFDANYTITLVSSVLYTHQTYTYLTVNERITKVVNTYAETPPALDPIVSDISDLKNQADAAVNNTQNYVDLKADFEYAQVLFAHIIDKIKVGNVSDIYEDLKDLVRVLNNNQIPQYVPKNIPILPYDISNFTGAPRWGRINGTISDQTDLWTILQDLTRKTNFVHDQQVASATWVIPHNMGKFPSVTIVDTANDEVEGEVRHNSINQLTITFTAAVAGKAYLN